MNRGSGFARGAEAMARKKAKAKRRTVAARKPSTRRAEPKDEAVWDNKDHRAWVTSHPCLCRNSPFSACDGPVDPHHCRKLGPKGTRLPRTDEITVPVCRGHHTGHPIYSMHSQTAERDVWKMLGIDPRWFIIRTKVGRAYLEKKGLMP